MQAPFFWGCMRHVRLDFVSLWWIQRKGWFVLCDMSQEPDEVCGSSVLLSLGWTQSGSLSVLDSPRAKSFQNPPPSTWSAFWSTRLSDESDQCMLVSTSLITSKFSLWYILTSAPRISPPQKQNRTKYSFHDARTGSLCTGMQTGLSLM